jgi:hypothetical protein
MGWIDKREKRENRFVVKQRGAICTTKYKRDKHEETRSAIPKQRAKEGDNV